MSLWKQIRQNHMLMMIVRCACLLLEFMPQYTYSALARVIYFAASDIMPLNALLFYDERHTHKEHKRSVLKMKNEENNAMKEE